MDKPFENLLSWLKPKSTVDIFEVGKIYRVFLKNGMSTQEFINRGGNPDIANAIWDKWHMWLIVSIDETHIYFFTLTSRFFNILFNEEVGSIKDFYDVYACPQCKGKLTGKYRALMNTIEKYKGGKDLLDPDFIYLLHKSHYKLNYETLIKLNKLNKGMLSQMDKYIENEELDVEFKADLRLRDKWALAEQILANLDDSELHKITKVDNEALERIANSFLV